MAKKDKSRSDKPTPTLKERIGENFDVPSDLLCGGSMLEIRGRGEAYVCGCKKIISFNEDMIRLEMSDFDIIINGERLSCFTFCEGRIVIGGRVKNIEIDDRGTSL